MFLQNWGKVVGQFLVNVPQDERVRQIYRNMIKTAIAERAPVQEAFSLLRGEEQVYYSTTLSPILTQQGVLIGLVGMNLNTTLQIQNIAKMRQLSARLIKVQEDERSHLSREIHDSLGQYLTALKLEIGAVVKGLENNDENALVLLESAKATINEAVRVGRSLTQLLRTPVLDDFGLRAALEEFIEDFRKKWQIQVVFKAVHMDVPLPREVETTLYRVLQEACTNVLKYARAERLEIRLKRTDRRVVLAVRDWGVGFDRNALADNKENFGLLGMKDRIGLLGGRFRILSQVNQGTLVIAMVPLHMGDAS